MQIGSHIYSMGGSREKRKKNRPNQRATHKNFHGTQRFFRHYFVPSIRCGEVETMRIKRKWISIWEDQKLRFCPILEVN